MVEVFLDTNVIFKENFFRSVFAEAVLKGANFLGITILIPEIVIDEVKGNFEKELRERFDKYKKIKKHLDGLIELQDQKIILDNEIDKYNQGLDDFLSKYDVRILPYLDIPVKEIIAKSYEAKKPFKVNKEGYKDYVIWQTIKNHCNKEPYLLGRLFVTDNVNDFCEKGANNTFNLHPDLIATLENVKEPPKIILSLKDFFNLKINPLLKTANPKDIPNLNIQETVGTILENDMLNYTADGFWGLPFGCEVTISSILDEPSIDKIHFSELNKNDILISVGGAIYVEVDGFMDKSEYYSSDDETIYVEEADYNDHVMRVSQCIETSFEVTILYSKKDKKALDYEFKLPDEVNYNDH